MKHVMTLRLLCLFIPCVFIACGDSGGRDGEGDDAGGETVRSLATGGVSVGGAMAGTDEPNEALAAGESASTAQAGVSTDETPTPDACTEICAKYEACNRSDIGPSGTAENCKTTCRTVDELPSFEDYRSCVAEKSCEALDACPLPMSFANVGCTDVCEALASETCMGDRRVPSGFPQVDSCLSACEENVTLRGQIRSCGEDMVRSPETCDEATFAWCLIRAQNTNCAQICDRKSQCREGVDRIDCALECITEDDAASRAMSDADPVAQRRAQEQRSCILNAGSCMDYDACFAPKGKQIDDAQINALCAADADCGFLPTEDQCPPTAQALLLATEASAGACLADHFENQCADSPLGCIKPYIPASETCAEYCQVAGQCERLPEGLTRNECQSTCEAAIEAQDLSQIAPFRVGLNCAYEANCAEFSTCLEGAGELSCEQFCERRTDCMTPNADECADTCPGRAGTLRSWAERTCTQAAGACDGVNRCVAQTPPPCDRLCAQRGAVCGDASADCETRCDDDDFIRPDGFLPTYACLAVTTDCDERALCDGASTSGLACLNWCQEAQGCGGEVSDLLDCVDRCAAGFEADDAIQFFNAEMCLREAGAGAACADLTGCIAEVDVDAVCGAYCGALGPDECAIIPEDGCVRRCTMALQLGQTGLITPSNHNLGGLAHHGGAHGGQALDMTAGAPAAGSTGQSSQGGRDGGLGGHTGGTHDDGATDDDGAAGSAGGQSTVGGSSTGGAVAGVHALGGASVSGGIIAGAASAGAATAGLPSGGAVTAGIPSGGAVTAGIPSDSAGAVGGALGGAVSGGAAMGGAGPGGTDAGGMLAPTPAAHMPTIESIGCVLSARQRNLDCAVVAQCVGAAEADENGCPEATVLCLPTPSNTCANYCTAKAGCDSNLDVFRCRRQCTPDPEGLAIKATCAGLVAGCTGADGCARWPACLTDGQLPMMCDEQQQCDQLEACEAADSVIPEQCVNACDAVNGCADGALFGEADNAVAQTIEQCRIDCAAQSVIDASGRAAYLDGLQGCLDALEPGCDGVGERACMHGSPLVDCAAAAAALGDCADLGMFGLPASANDYIMECQMLARQDASAAQMEVDCILDASMNGGIGLPPIPIMGLEFLECLPYAQCFGGFGP
ncbi:MAG: hypothetical protein VX589_03010 [Myxococcota bacterium]|nr:hypothetical protein [Myxococcota bacterium]